MNSLKTTIVCVVLLGVLYGMYQVINTPAPSTDDSQAVLDAELGTQVDPSELDLFNDDPDFSFAEEAFSDRTESVKKDAPPALSSDSTQPPTRFAADSGSNSSNWDESDPADTGDSSTDDAALKLPGTSPQYGSSGGDLKSPANSNFASDSSSGIGGQSSTVPGNSSTSNGSLSIPGDGGNPASGSFAAGGSSTGSTSSPNRTLGYDQEATLQLAEVWIEVENLVAESRYQDALTKLSAFYDDSRLTPEEADSLQEWLDALARKVIYSTEHHLHLPYIARGDDTLEDVAIANEVPPSLLYNVNAERLENQGWQAGFEVKVIQGPFRATVNLQSQRLTLWLGDMYAGSMPITVGQNPQPIEGSYRVAAKSDSGRVFFTQDGNSIDKLAPQNPYGKYSLDLGSGLLIHGSGNATNVDSRGCIILSPGDAKDVYEILGRNSEVTIRR